jgi:hypothetical protein
LPWRWLYGDVRDVGKADDSESKLTHYRPFGCLLGDLLSLRLNHRPI